MRHLSDIIHVPSYWSSGSRHKLIRLTLILHLGEHVFFDTTIVSVVLLFKLRLIFFFTFHNPCIIHISDDMKLHSTFLLHTFFLKAFATLYKSMKGL